MALRVVFVLLVGNRRKKTQFQLTVTFKARGQKRQKFREIPWKSMLIAAVVSHKELHCQRLPWLFLFFFFFKHQLLRLWHCPTLFCMFLIML